MAFRAEVEEEIDFSFSKFRRLGCTLARLLDIGIIVEIAGGAFLAGAVSG
jgi:hypothetical protein